MDEKRGTGAPRATDTKHKKKKGQAKELKNFYRFQVTRFFFSSVLLFFSHRADHIPLCNMVMRLAWRRSFYM
jgi:hypothetical protein